MHGTFQRQLLLGDGLDVDRMHATYEHGVLTVTIPVAEKAKPRKIEVAVNGAQTSVGTGDRQENQNNQNKEAMETTGS